VLLRKPDILLLDEPTKGLDPISKDSFSKILQNLQEEGLTVVMSTHDIEFAAQNATKCGMMFQGNITSENAPKEFFKGNYFYTTMVQRLFRHLSDKEIVTLEEAISLCKSEVK
jgi:energy-coupling factor transport system ATP-binding protein